MKRRFSAEELFEVRNSIPINTLIEELLAMPTKTTEGLLRFVCPKCHGFQTATNCATNLARCFLCETNFNPIDLVMLVKGSGFVESVTYLKRVLNEKKRVNDMVSGIGRPMQENR